MTVARSASGTHAALVEHIDERVPLSSSTVLDLGCGTGGIAGAVSERCEAIVVSDIEQESVRAGLAKTGETAVGGCRLHAGELPFRDDRFDVVIMNGVLEWVPDARDDDPRVQQVRTLAEARRVLAPEGMLYLGIETRYYAPYVAGITDHSGLPWAAILPRPLADAYSQAVRGRQYANYLYTVPGYRRLLREAGFERVEAASALPSYKRPQRIVPLDRMDEIRAALDEVDEPGWRSAIRRLLARDERAYELFGTEVVLTAR